jgi:hypothetical protein
MDPDAQSTSATPTEVMEHRPWPGSTGSTSEISTKRCRAVANFLEAAAHATAYGQEARNQAAEVADLP